MEHECLLIYVGLPNVYISQPNVGKPWHYRPSPNEYPRVFDDNQIITANSEFYITISYSSDVLQRC